MVLYSLEDLSINEIKVLRQSLNHLPIKGVDAPFMVLLQNKLDIQLSQIEKFIQEEEKKKQESLEKSIIEDQQLQKPTSPKVKRA